MTRKLSLLTCLSLLCLGLFFLSNSTLAKNDRVTRGEAMSVLHAWTTGRVAVFNNNGIGAGHFDSEFTDVTIRPSGFFDGKHYCEEDHLLAALAWYSTTADNYKDAKASLDTVKHEIFIDGHRYDTIRTTVRQAVQQSESFGVDRVYGYSEGTIFAPGDLSVGAHTLTVPIYFGDVLFGPFSITFHIDAAGTGVCL